jgi:hypothetical protein
MTDAEQQGLLFSRHAPFFPRYMSADGPFATDEVECHAPGAKPPGAPVGIRHESGWCFTDDLGDVEAKWFGGLGYRLRDYEARTTQAAIAQAVADRLDAARRASYA